MTLNASLWDHPLGWAQPVAREVLKLQRGITCAAILERHPGKERLITELLGADPDTFQQELLAAADWSRQHQLAVSGTVLQTGCPLDAPAPRTAGSAHTLQTAIAAFILDGMFPSSFIAALLEVPELALGKLYRRGDAWFWREVDHRTKAAKG